MQFTISLITMHSKNDVGKQYHIGCGQGDLEETLLVPGDPDRIPKIASSWDSSTEVASNREFRSIRGLYHGLRISALSSGIGPACMSIVVNEASRIGVKNFIRVGSTGTLQPNIACGDVVISSAAVRLDAASDCYVVPEYPAAAHYEVLLALIEAAEQLGSPRRRPPRSEKSGRILSQPPGPTRPGSTLPTTASI